MSHLQHKKSTNLQLMLSCVTVIQHRAYRVWDQITLYKKGRMWGTLDTKIASCGMSLVTKRQAPKV